MNVPNFHPAFSNAGTPFSLPEISKRSTFLIVLLATLAALLPALARAQLYTETSKLVADYSYGMGQTVSASRDGSALLIGSPTGKRSHEDGFRMPAYVFVRNGSGWTLQQTLDVPDSDVAIDGDSLVAGGEFYGRSGNTWTLQHSVYVENPESAIQGNTAIIASPYDRATSWGSIRVYVRNGSTWTEQAVLSPEAGSPYSESLGSSVALDGDTVIGGTGYRGSSGGAYVFVRNGTTWSLQARLPVPSGNPLMQVALEGDTAAVSDPTNNRVHLFTRTGTTWALTHTVTRPATGGNSFGNVLALNGGILAVGAHPYFYLYARTSSGWVLTQTIARNPTVQYTAAVANGGKLFLMGEPNDNDRDGSATVYSVPPPPAPGSGWRGQDIGAVGLAGNSSGSGTSATVSGSGADIWGGVDQFHFRSETLTGDGAIIARVDSAGGGNGWAKAGLMFRESVAPASRNVMALVTPGNRTGLQVRAATADATAFTEKWGGGPIWLMLARTGDVFDAFRSTDGDTWTPIGSSTVKMPATIHVGLAVTSHNNAALNTGTFSGIELVGLEEPPPPPATLTGSALGTVAVPGSHTESDGTLTIDAAGVDIWGNADSGHFVHREITGDFDLRARVTSLTNTNVWAKAGLMVRESLSANSRNVFALLTAGNAAGLQVRDTAAGATTWTAGPWVRAPYWVRLTRVGNVFTAMVSANGTTWQTLGTQTVALATTLHAGVAVTSHAPNTATRATVTDLNFGQ